MFWLTLITGIQILGFAVTLARLAYDEWQQWRLSRKAREIDAGRPDLREARAMENENRNVNLPVAAADKRGRPHRNFHYPHQVVSDPDLGMDEKRAILSAWASDEHAVESMPALRHLPGTPAAVTFASIMDARALLDRMANAANDDDPPPSPIRVRNSRSWRPMKAAA